MAARMGFTSARAIKVEEFQPGRGWAYDSYSKSQPMAGLPAPNDWQVNPWTKFSSVTQPSDAFVFIEEADPRGYNAGTWVMYRHPSWLG